MALLVAGVLLFAGVHLIPSLAPGLRNAWHSKLGEGGYKGTFSLLLLLSFALMIMGWRSTPPQYLYTPVAAAKHPAMGLLLIAFLLMVVSARPSRLKQWIRHPQLSGLLLWGFAHLLLNGDVRSTVLFGGLTVWAAIEIVAINRRDGAWVKADLAPWSADLVNLVIAVIAVIAVVFLHPYISGMPVT